MGKPQSKKSWLIIGSTIIAIIIIIGGLNMFKIRTDEERRDHEYEVSLVKTLKNTYAGIEEIKITDPEYSDKPESWVTKIEILFSDKVRIKYRLGYDKKTKEIRSRTLEKENMKFEKDYLENHKGKTIQKIKVTYSDGEKGEQ